MLIHCKHVGGAVQVMLAQQESIARLMSMYEAVRMEGPSACQASQPQLQAVKQESSMGKAGLKQDRSAYPHSKPGKRNKASSFLSFVSLLSLFCDPWVRCAWPSCDFWLSPV